ncbi:retrovirus-related pol polyprotein from transposon TNT 1-94 [Tanacetum coccineum]
MSNTNTNLQTQTSNALHNAIMEACGKDHPPMLAPGNYVSGNPESTDTSTPNLIMNSSTIVSRIHPTNSNGLRRFFQLQKIDNDIYSTVDACPNACEMWKAIKRLKQGESINVQDLETNLYWEFGKFTSRDGESLESYYSRFYKMMNELVKNQCDVTNHQVNVQFLLQLQPEWQSFVMLVKSQQAATKNRGKAIVNSPPLTYDQEPTTMSKEKEIDKLMVLISLSFKKIYKPTNNNLRTSSNTSTQVMQQSEIQCYNCKEYGHVAMECQKPKWAKDATYHKEKMLLCKQEEAGIQFKREHHVQPKSVNDTYLEVQGDTNITIEPLDMNTSRETVDQDDNDIAKERDLLASLIEKFKCEINDNKH